MNQAQSIGVTVSETAPDITTATLTVTANSRSRRPITPPMNRMGMNTATSETVMETMVKATSAVPSMAACSGGLCISRWRMMFSITTMASSTTKPTAMLRAMIDRLSRL